MTNPVNVATLYDFNTTFSGGSSVPSVWLEGHFSAGDGGGGMFTYVSRDTSSGDNTGTIIIDSTGNNRYYREVRVGPYNILWFGGYFNGLQDNTTALNNALGALPSGGGEIYFPPGKYLFNSQISFSLPSGRFSVSFSGSGADVTILNWANADHGLYLTASEQDHSFQFRDMSITTQQVGGGYIGVFLAQSAALGQFAQSDFTRVTFQGHVNISEYWSYCIYIDGLSNVSFDTCLFYGGTSSGVGIILEGNPTTTPIVFNVSKCGFFNIGYGIYYGNYVQGVTVSQTNFVNGTTGIYVAISAGTGVDQLSVVGCEFNTTGHPIDIESELGDLYIIGCDFYVPANYSGVYINHAGQGAVIQGNSFTPFTTLTGTSGINVPAGFTYGVITGNVFIGLATGVNLSGASNWNVQSNVYQIPTGYTDVVPGTGNSVGGGSK